MEKNPWPRLRPADNKDREKIAELVYSILKEYNLRPDPDSTDADLSDIEKSYFQRGGSFYILEEKTGSIIGAYGLYPIDKATCELRKMYLHASFRGKGFGNLLLDSALAEARKLGFKRITLETASVLKEAIGLYKSYGFAEYQPQHLSARCDQAYLLELK